MTDTRNGFVIDSRAGNRNGSWMFANSADYELSIEDVRGGFEMGLLVDLDYALDNSGLPRQDPRTIPDAAYINLGHNRIGSFTLGRIPLFNRNFRGIDGVKVGLNIFPQLKLEGLFGMRRALALASDNGIEHSYDGIAFGTALAGEIAGFGGRLSFMGGTKDGSATRRDLDAVLSWQIIRQIFAHAKISTNLIVKELAEVSGGLRLNFDPVAISGHAGWTDPSLMLFDADDPWIVFASERQRQEGADVSVRLASQRLLLGASFLHGSNIEYGLGAFVKFLGMLRGGFNYTKDSDAAGSGSSVSAYLAAARNFGPIALETRTSFMQSSRPVFDQGQTPGDTIDSVKAGGFHVAATVPIGPCEVSVQHDSVISNRSPVRHTTFASFRYPRTTWAGGITADAESSATSTSLPKPSRGGTSLVVYPQREIKSDPYMLDDFHKYHAGKNQGCEDCHDQVSTSEKSSDNLAQVNCKNCHGDEATAPPSPAIESPRIIFSHKKHAGDKKIACEKCHPDVEKKGMATRDDLPSMKVCTDCHTKTKASTGCPTCHPTHPTNHSKRMQSLFSVALVPSGRTGKNDRHTEDFLYNGGHGAAAKIDQKYCESCHSPVAAQAGEPKACGSCHRPKALAKTNPHLLTGTENHPDEARRSPQKCGTCHDTETFCKPCHDENRPRDSFAGLPASHGSGWLSVSGGMHASMARNQIAQCVACHDTAFPRQSSQTSGNANRAGSCMPCHSTFANPHGSGNSARLEHLRENNPESCRPCHTR